MPVYQNGQRQGSGEEQSSVVGSAPQDASSIQDLLAQIALLTKGMAAAQGIQLQGGADVDPAESLQRLAEAASNIGDEKIVDAGIGDTSVVKADETSRNTLDILKDL